MEFEIWYLSDLGLDSQPVNADSLADAEDQAIALYGDLVVDVRLYVEEEGNAN